MVRDSTQVAKIKRIALGEYSLGKAGVGGPNSVPGHHVFNVNYSHLAAFGKSIYGFGGGVGVNCAKLLRPSLSSILLMFFSASSKPSLPNILRSMPSNWSEISSTCWLEKFVFHARKMMGSSRAA